MSIIFYAHSDTHGCQVGLPEGDVLIHAGDAFCGDDVASLRSDLRKFGELPHRFKLWVLGNHDLVLTHLLKTQPEAAWSLLKSAGVQLLIDESVEIDGLRFYGVGWGTSVAIPTSDVVISHCPARGLLDQRHPPESEHLGSPALAKQIEAVKPRVFVCGHIHGGYGRAEHDGTTFLAGQLVHMSSATAMTDCVLLHVEKKQMMLVMSREPKLSALFVKYLLKRNIRYQDDLVDQLFNSSEKRLARVLLLMAHFGKEGVSETLVPRLSQETLAEMVGTTRSRVSFFMNRFRKLGFINYDVGDNLCGILVCVSMTDS